MSYLLPPVNLAAAVVGKTGTVSWDQVAYITTLAQTQQSGNGTIRVRNESGAGLSITFQGSGDTAFIAAGEWGDFHVAPNERSFSYVVEYVIPNAPVTTLFVTYYGPDEPLDTSGNLGNSPIGLSGSVQTSVTQVIQDGQTIGLIIMESTPLGHPQTILVTTDGKAFFAGPLTIDNGAILSNGSGSLLMTGTMTSEAPSGNSAFVWNAIAGTNTPGMLDINPTDAGQKHWVLLYNGNDQHIQLFNITDNVNALDIAPTGNTLIAGAVSSLGGQATVGSFGVPAIIGESGLIHVTSAAATTILTLTLPTDGKYRLSTTLEIHNTGTSTPRLNATFTGHTGSADSIFIGANDDKPAPTLNAYHFMDGASCSFAAGFGNVGPIVETFWGNSTFTLTYTTNATANDYISATLERLA